MAKTTVVLDPKNLAHLHEHMDSPHGMSALINSILRDHFVYGPIHKRIKEQADRLDKHGLDYFLGRGQYAGRVNE